MVWGVEVGDVVTEEVAVVGSGEGVLMVYWAGNIE